MSGRRAQRRDVHGIVLLDKPVGSTSNAALQRVKRLFNARKAGHTGSLDPLASGLLPICLGEATKVSGYLLDANKRYLVSAALGARTDTGDAEGSVVERGGATSLDPDLLEATLAQFRGTIEQIPPMYSALKHKGQRLYDLARKGIEVERKPRAVTLHELRLVSAADGGFELDVTCSKGTYVRTLVEDIAAAAGALAHVTALRRTLVGPFDETQGLVTLEELCTLADSGPAAMDEVVRPMDEAMADRPGVRLGRESAWYLQQGQPVTVPGAPVSGWVRLYAGNSRFIGMGEVLDDGRIAPRRLFRHAGSC